MYKFFIMVLMVLTAMAPRSPALADPLPRLRILTYNIHHGEGTDGRLDLERQARIITAVAPDLVALQEVDRATERSRGIDQAEELGRLTGMHAVFGKAIDYAGGEYGQAILSRVAIAGPTVHRLPRVEETEPRIAFSVRVQPHEDLPELRFASTHLCHRVEANRLVQARAINRVFPAEGGPPAILAGDLNARPGSAPIAEFETQWRDTIPHEDKIDYILIRESDPWRVVETAIIDDRIASDHPPVLVVLEWLGDTP